jgi:transposase
MQRIRPQVPRSRGIPPLDDGRVAVRLWMGAVDAPPGYGPHKTLYNRFVRSSRMGVFSRIFAALAGEAGEPDRLILGSTQLKAHRTTASLRKRGRLIAASAAPRAG